MHISNVIKTTGFAALLFLSISACERDDPKPPDTTSVGGKGGNAALNVIPHHHEDNIDDCTIYIKYNATTAPSSYDDSVKCVQKDGKPVATFSGLKKGNYYLLGLGYDPEIGEAVKGGMTFSVTEEKSYELYLAVTEDH